MLGGDEAGIGHRMHPWGFCRDGYDDFLEWERAKHDLANAEFDFPEDGDEWLARQKEEWRQEEENEKKKKQDEAEVEQRMVAAAQAEEEEDRKWRELWEADMVRAEERQKRKKEEKERKRAEAEEVWSSDEEVKRRRRKRRREWAATRPRHLKVLGVLHVD